MKDVRLELTDKYSENAINTAIYVHEDSVVIAFGVYEQCRTEVRMSFDSARELAAALLVKLPTEIACEAVL